MADNLHFLETYASVRYIVFQVRFSFRRLSFNFRRPEEISRNASSAKVALLSRCLGVLENKIVTQESGVSEVGWVDQ